MRPGSHLSRDWVEVGLNSGAEWQRGRVSLMRLSVVVCCLGCLVPRRLKEGISYLFIARDPCCRLFRDMTAPLLATHRVLMRRLRPWLAESGAILHVCAPYNRAGAGGRHRVASAPVQKHGLYLLCAWRVNWADSEVPYPAGPTKVSSASNLAGAGGPAQDNVESCQTALSRWTPTPTRGQHSTNGTPRTACRALVCPT